MLAARHLKITGNKEYARNHIEEYHKCGEFLLSLRRPGEDLPICENTWDGQGLPIWSKEPYFIAECYAGLNYLAGIDEALGNIELAAKWRTEAQKIKKAALKDYTEGGLWDPERGTFIRMIDYRDPKLWGPDLFSWGLKGPMEKGIPRTEFLLYETTVPIFLGLLDDSAKIRKAYAWIDANYDYASGRGGLRMPPQWGQAYNIFFDIMNRKKYNIPGADNLLQLLLDHAMDAGIPLREGTIFDYTRWGAHAGRMWDNSPYFRLVINMHYGLDYSYKGWKISDPNPLRDYTLTKISNLRHKDAVYTITWKGHGKVKSIKVDGKNWPSDILTFDKGEHSVEVMLN
jgi:hypothetical protein